MQNEPLEFADEPAVPNVSNVSIVRKLGGTEQLFWLLDRHRPTHFVMAAQIDRVFVADAWRAALHAVQQRHVLLTTRIVSNDRSPLAFHRDDDARIPLRVIRGDANVNANAWPAQAERELREPFDTSVAPLVRATVVQDECASTLLLVAHHSVLDGMGGAYVIEDLLRALAGETLDRLPVVQPLETLLRDAIDQSDAPPAPTPAPQAKVFRPVGASSLRVDARQLDASLTRALVERARRERTTVHGALAAAVHEAARRVSAAWRARPLRTVTPIDVRAQTREAGKANGVYITQTITVDDHPPGADFWNAARAVKAQLAPAQARENVVKELKGLDAVMATQPSVEHAAGFLGHVLAFDVLLSNLGDAPIPSNYAGLKLEALWGPLVSSGFADDQVIGVCTLDGVLRITHASYGALPELLVQMEAVLRDAVAP
ncbi:condensation domain-containing protein [Paraburkholderia sp. Ac-20347]|uniref:phthiocerol/phthiodiolone dimycocerosyl transferase family protein n=1 Tax=Paraburkholderia sp. Ac-20347 TaxID=2703892 RepID=UPI0019812A62|nr:condensation domain-containing protein [Paraburkholderia sp. Ac-20347]MBN3808250.1 condensation protein [Paraburkholderia sp. Ac-20347]